MLLGEETSGNHQAYRRGHPDITILNEIIKGQMNQNLDIRSLASLK